MTYSTSPKVNLWGLVAKLRVDMWEVLGSKHLLSGCWGIEKEAGSFSPIKC